jgi:membrane protein DedA with SNARE-associated domain
MPLEDYARIVVEFVRVHHAWAAPIVFTLAFLESIALFSLLVPGWAALVGAALGDWVYKFKNQTRHRRF